MLFLRESAIPRPPFFKTPPFSELWRVLAVFLLPGLSAADAVLLLRAAIHRGSNP